MTGELEDFLYRLDQMDNADLTNHALDDVWLAELSDEELIGLIHIMANRLPREWIDFEDEDEWFEETEVDIDDDGSGYDE